MATVVALVPDLMFGSRVQAMLTAEGHQVRLVSTPDAARAATAATGGTAGGPGSTGGPGSAGGPGDRGGQGGADGHEHANVLVVDLTDERLDGTGLVEAMRDAGELHGVRTLAFYSHVEADTRARALAAGFDLVVPRSRMAREGAQLVEGLLDRQRLVPEAGG